MRVKVSGLILVVLLALLMAGCGSSLAPATTEPTAVPATAVPTGTTGSLGPTTSTTEVPPPTLGPGIFSDALAKAKSATTYRVELQLAGNGLFNPMNSLPAGQSTATPTQVSGQLFPLVAMKGGVNGQDQHLTISGAMSAFLGVDPEKGLEVVKAGGKSFLHGPAPMLGAAEDKWYEVPEEQAGLVTPPVEPANVFDAFAQTGVNPNDFKSAGTETLDGQTCGVYVGDQAVTLKAFQELNKSSSTNETAQYDIDSADFRFWVCPDGSLRQAKLSLDAHTAGKPDDKGSFLLFVHVYDLGGSVSIQPPAQSELLKPQLPPEASPTP